MARKWSKALLFMLVVALLIGCSARKSRKQLDALGDAESGVSVPAMELDEYMEELVDNFLVVLDASGSKFRPYNGQVKLRIAKEVVRRFNENTPDRELIGALRRYGFEAGAFSEPTALIFGLGKYDRPEYGRAIETIRWAGGKSPLAMAMNAATLDLTPTKDYIAVVIVSDGKINDDDPLLNAVLMEMDDNATLASTFRKKSESPTIKTMILEMASDPDLAERTMNAIAEIMDKQNDLNKVETILGRNSDLKKKLAEIDKNPVIAAKVMLTAVKIPNSLSVQAARHMKNTYKDRICIYTVQVGDLPYGKNLLEQIALEGGCGYSVTADYLKPDKNLKDWEHDVFTRGKPTYIKERKYADAGEPPCTDSDGDGVCDEDDECPGTPIGAKVDERGCWILEKVQFDLNKWNIKPQYYQILNDVATVLLRNPHLKMEIHGHTCTIWTEQYNMKLSHWRALSVTSYLLKKGVNSRQLSVKGFGFSKPYASNKTDAGRSLNRRAEFHPIR